jgi:Methyltransferase domain
MTYEDKKETTLVEEPPAPEEQEQREPFVNKVLQAVLGAQLVQTAYLGHKLGWYQTLSEQHSSDNNSNKGMTPLELAKATESSARYAREWLEQQTVAGWIVCQNPEESSPEARRFVLPKEHATVLTDVLALDYMMSLPVMLAGWGKDIDKLLQAYKHDTGFGWEEMTLDTREQQAAQNRPFFLNGMPDVLEQSLNATTVKKLKMTGGKVADIGAGYCWSSVGVARHFPAALVHAYDVDEPSVIKATKIMKEEGLGDRVVARCVDAAAVVKDVQDDPYDLVMALECIHDLNDPISVLRTMRLLSGTTGEVIVMDGRVAESFQEALANKNPVEQIMYGFSCVCCLPVGKSRPNSVETGTVMRPSVLRMYAQQAGFRDIEILPAENVIFRFYKLLK